jgi:hypothetical protein
MSISLFMSINQDDLLLKFFSLAVINDAGECLIIPYAANLVLVILSEIK